MLPNIVSCAWSADCDRTSSIVVSVAVSCLRNTLNAYLPLRNTLSACRARARPSPAFVSRACAAPRRSHTTCALTSRPSLQCDRSAANSTGSIRYLTPLASGSIGCLQFDAPLALRFCSFLSHDSHQHRDEIPSSHLLLFP